MVVVRSANKHEGRWTYGAFVDGVSNHARLFAERTTTIISDHPRLNIQKHVSWDARLSSTGTRHFRPPQHFLYFFPLPQVAPPVVTWLYEPDRGQPSYVVSVYIRRGVIRCCGSAMLSRWFTGIFRPLVVLYEGCKESLRKSREDTVLGAGEQLFLRSSRHIRMAKPSVDKFVDLLGRSRLVEPEQLAPFLRELKAEAESVPNSAGSTRLSQRLVDAGLITDWQSQKLLEGRHKGFFLGKYKLLGHIQAGGMSNVYLAEHKLMHRQVAIKVLPKNRVENSSYLERFMREAQAVGSLDHENIVKAYDVDQEGLSYFLVMEYIHGRDLRIIVNQDGPLEYARAARYIRQAAQGLAYAHAAGLIHRDMKPANLLVDQNDVVKVLDLGLARFTDETQASLTMANNENVLGTVDYLAPEQAIDSHGVDGRTDIYSLGCSLYFLLTGHPPFPDGSLARRLMMHQKRAPRSISKERPGAPEGLVRICTKMMAKKPADRYQSAVEVSQVLDGWLEAYSPSDGSGIDSVRPTAEGGSSGRRFSTVAAKVDKKFSEAMPADEDEPADSGLLGSASTAADTDIQPDQTTVQVPRQSGSHTSAAGDSAPRQAPLPTAEPVEDDPSPVAFLAGAESPAVSRLRAKAHLTMQDVETYRQREKTLPIWVWVVLGGSCLLTLILSVIFIFGR
jgi:eukaryotic-like serine/threonine-protein kinase